MANKIKIGVFGARRGISMSTIMAKHPDAELVAICDWMPQHLNNAVKEAESAGCKVTGYTDFDQFFNHDMDAVVLANYATEHAPYAVKLLKSGRHVTSEVLACQTLAEAVMLAEAVEESGKVYTYAENYCYFTSTQEMREIYKRGDIGEFLHGEGEYVHDCESIWVDITYGNKNHWRNWVPSTFYCTHSIGPILTITGTRPTRITAYETPNVNKQHFGCRSGDGAVIVCQMSNGAIAKFLPWANFRKHPGVWYAVYGTNGEMETDRWGNSINVVNTYIEGKGYESHTAQFPFETELSKSIGGHGGSDFYTMHYFLEAILDRPAKEYAIDVYTAIDMTLPGILGYKSILQGNVPIECPDFRNPVERDKYRNDHWSFDPKNAGPGQPEASCSFGKVEIDDSIYERQAKEYESR